MSEEINHDRRRFLGTAAMTLAAAQTCTIGSVKAQASKMGELSSLDSAD